jgi:hypothetical protein
MHLAEFANLAYSIVNTYGPSYMIFVVSFYISSVIIALNLLIAIFLDVLNQARDGPTVFHLTAEDVPEDVEAMVAHQRGQSQSATSTSARSKPRTESYFDETEMANVAVVKGHATLAGCARRSLAALRRHTLIRHAQRHRPSLKLLRVPTARVAINVSRPHQGSLEDERHRARSIEGGLAVFELLQNRARSTVSST